MQTPPSENMKDYYDCWFHMKPNNAWPIKREDAKTYAKTLEDSLRIWQKFQDMHSDCGHDSTYFEEIQGHLEFFSNFVKSFVMNFKEDEDI